MAAQSVRDLAAKYGDDDVMLTRAEAAEFCRRSVVTLERWARVGIGPNITRSVGSRPLYRLRDLRQFLGLDDTAGKAA